MVASSAGLPALRGLRCLCCRSRYPLVASTGSLPAARSSRSAGGNVVDTQTSALRIHRPRSGTPLSHLLARIPHAGTRRRSIMALCRVAGPFVLLSLLRPPGRLQPPSLLRPRASAGTSPLRTRVRRLVNRLGLRPHLWLCPLLSRDVSTPSTLPIHQRKILTTSVRLRSSTSPPVTTRVGGNFRSPTRQRKPVTTFSKSQRGHPMKCASVLTS